MDIHKITKLFFPVAAIGFLLFFLVAGSYTVYKEFYEYGWDSPVASVEAAPTISQEDATAFMDTIRHYLNHPNDDTVNFEPYKEWLKYPVHIDIYSHNTPLGEAYSFGGDMRSAVDQLLQNYQASQTTDEGNIPNDAEMVLSFFYAPKDGDFLAGKESMLDELLYRGHSGAVFQCKDSTMLMPPMRWTTYGFMNEMTAAETYYSSMGCSASQNLSPGMRYVTAYNTKSFIQYHEKEQAKDWYGVDRLVQQDEVTKKRMELFLLQSGEWFEKHLSSEGKLTYYYYPSLDKVADDNQLIRQWLSTRAIGEIATYFDDENLYNQYFLNMNYNMTHYGQWDGERIYFPLEKTAYLATNNVAAHAFTTVPESLSKHRTYYSGIINGIMHQWRDDGMLDSVITYNKKYDRPGQDRTFAAGSAFIAIGDAVRNETIALEEAAFRPTFDFYYDYWMRKKQLYNSAWQATGYFHLYQAFKNDVYLDATLDVVDHLVSCQIVEDDQTPQDTGSYALAGCQNGSTRSISTGVRLEALTAGYRAAKVRGDEERMQRYRASALLAFRHVLQGQIREDNSFYLPNPDRAIGGIRDSYGNNFIRNDNVAHTVSGVYAALSHIDGLFPNEEDDESLDKQTDGQTEANASQVESEKETKADKATPDVFDEAASED